MIRRILVMITLFGLVGTLRVTAQEQASVRYGVAFTHGEYTYVALLNTADEWTVTNLGMQLASPTWSPDGQTIYGISLETVDFTAPAYNGVLPVTFGRNIQVFQGPDWYPEKTIEVLPKATLGDQTQGDILSINSISPDGHYAWVTSTNDTHGSALVDLVNDAVLFQSICTATVLDWTDTFVITSNRYSVNPNCGPRVTSIDLATGIGRALGPISFFVGSGVYLPSADLVIGNIAPEAGVAYIGLLPRDASPAQEINPALYPAASPDGRYLAYVGLIPLSGELRLLDLQTHQTVVIDQGNLYDLAWQDDTLRYIRFESDNDTTHVVRVQVDANLQRTEEMIYDGPRLTYGSTDYIFEGNSTTFAVRIYLMDELIWDSHAAYPDEQFSLVKGPAYDVEAVHGRWLWMSTSTNYVVLDLETRQLVQQPPEGYTPTGISPDGSWLIGTTRPLPTDDPGSIRYGVVAYQPATGESVTLVEKQMIADYRQMADFSIPPNSFYTWWSHD